jgi:hypothetical protein
LESGANQFKNELLLFLKGLGGEVLSTAGSKLSTDLFDRYFAVLQPFEVVEDKKLEFSDAAALLVLEQSEKDKSEIGVMISNDRGWRSFANQSEHLFCVKSLGEFTGLFAALSDHAKHLLAKI